MQSFDSLLMSFGMLLFGLALGLGTTFVPVRRGETRLKKRTSSPPPSPAEISSLNEPSPFDPTKEPVDPDAKQARLEAIRLRRLDLQQASQLDHLGLLSRSTDPTDSKPCFIDGPPQHDPSWDVQHKRPLICNQLRP